MTLASFHIAGIVPSFKDRLKSHVRNEIKTFPQCTPYIYIYILIYIKGSKFWKTAIYIYGRSANETLYIYIYIYIIYLFTCWEVCVEKNCAQGLDRTDQGIRPRSVFNIKVTVFLHTDRPRLVNNVIIFFIF